MCVHLTGKRVKRDGCLFSKGGETRCFFYTRMMKHWGNLLHDFTTKYSKRRGQSCSWGNGTCWAALHSSQASVEMGVCYCSSQDLSRELLCTTNVLFLFCFSRILLPTPPLGFAVTTWWLPREVSGWRAWQLCPKAGGKATLTFPLRKGTHAEKGQTKHWGWELSQDRMPGALCFRAQFSLVLKPHREGSSVSAADMPGGADWGPQAVCTQVPWLQQIDQRALMSAEICRCGLTGGYYVTGYVLARISMQITWEPKLLGYHNSSGQTLSITG